MKAILVIDLNDTQLKEWDTDTSKCWAEIKVHTPIKGGTHGIGCVYANDNVELKPMPKEKEDESCSEYDCFLTRFQGGVGDKTCYRCGEANGYNACIDEILGGSK